jgi:hypothetical protein
MTALKTQFGFIFDDGFKNTFEIYFFCFTGMRLARNTSRASLSVPCPRNVRRKT